MGTEILELEGKELTTKLNEFFRKVDYVELAYLFGSHAKGKQGQERFSVPTKLPASQILLAMEAQASWV